jgi:hypothetical protein
MMPRIQYVPPDEKSGQLVTAETLKDDWSLICLKDQRCGWVLTSLLMFELPDEIVQLAEGHRITAFFKLGETTDPEDKRRPIYLWTTSTGPPESVSIRRLSRVRLERGPRAIREHSPGA